MRNAPVDAARTAAPAAIDGRLASEAMDDPDPSPPRPRRIAAARAAPAPGLAAAAVATAASTRSGRSRSCPPTRSRRSTARRCGSCAEIGVEVLGDRALDAFAGAGRDAWTGSTADGPPRPGPGRGRSSRLAPSRVRAPRPQPGARPRLRRRQPRLRRGRRAGVRHATSIAAGGRQLRRLRRLRPAHRRARRHPPGGRRTARADRPAGRDPPPRHVPDVRDRARQDLAVPRLRARPSVDDAIEVAALIRGVDRDTLVREPIAA